MRRLSHFKIIRPIIKGNENKQRDFKPFGNIHDKDIVVVGVSPHEEKFGYKIFKDLIKHGLKVNGVNPRNGQILGRKIYKTLRELERVPDLVITVVSPEFTERIVEECREMGIKGIWMQPGSESEIAIKKAKQYGIQVVYKRCFMVEYGIW
ncbi:MAG: CoA-binding protein [Candidatus Omnitrophica bacterium]|nr:CoA-binding protein [Candidatus Omnitrophota bacterium]